LNRYSNRKIKVLYLKYFSNECSLGEKKRLKYKNIKSLACIPMYISENIFQKFNIRTSI